MISRIVALAVAAELSALAVAAEKEQPIEGYFSPSVSCTEAIVRELSNAKQTVHVQAYSFTSQTIARALTEAERRGVKVIASSMLLIGPKIIQPLISSRTRALRRTSIQCRRFAHNKIMIIDGTTVLTGSFNFTKAADTHPKRPKRLMGVVATGDGFASNGMASDWNSRRA